jgi:hypothetical protein
MIRLFVGYDSELPFQAHVFAHSAVRRCSLPLSVSFLDLNQLRAIHNRPRDPLQTTEFAFTRFLVPSLVNFDGWAIFADGDMLCLGDLAELWALRDPTKTVQVVQHDAEKAGAQLTKFLGRPQTPYARKNWSSVMLMNCGYSRKLNQHYVDTAPGLELHQFAWTKDAYIGALPPEWNHLVSIDAPTPSAKIVHYTLGMPLLNGGDECEFAEEWRDEVRHMQRHVSLSLDMVYATRTRKGAFA